MILKMHIFGTALVFGACRWNANVRDLVSMRVEIWLAHDKLGKGPFCAPIN